MNKWFIGFGNKLLLGILSTVLLVSPLSSVAKDSAQIITSGAYKNNSTTVTLLGTFGGPDWNIRRSESASLLTVQGRYYLIDAGAGVGRRLRKDDVDPRKIKRIFITHNHLDHNAGLEPLISMNWFNGWYYSNKDYIDQKSKKPFVKIYGPPGTKEIFNAAMQYLSVSATIFNDGETGHGSIKKPREVFEEHTINRNGTFYNDGVVKVTAVENTHFNFPQGSTAAEAGYKSYSYRFDTPAGSVVFTGDTGPSSKVTKLAKGADVLVSEVLNLKLLEKRNPEAFNKKNHPGVKSLIKHMKTEHLTPEAVGKMAQDANVKIVILNHVVPGGTTPSAYSSFVAGVKKYFSGTVIMGQDLLQYTLVP